MKAALQDPFWALLRRESWVANHDQHQSNTLQKLLGSVISMEIWFHIGMAHLIASANSSSFFVALEHQ